MEVISAPEHEVIKPENDLKEYKFVELPNKVQAFLISTKKHLEHFQKNNKFASQDPSQKPELEEDPESPDSQGEEDDDDDYEDEIDEEDNDEFDINEADAKKFIAAAMELENNKAAAASANKDKKGLASVSVTVCAGSCDEPEDYPGLAHLLEHIISLGSKEFPEEDAFSKFISRHGGFENAFTSLNTTTYEFDIDNKYLSEALYRFSRLLKEPLLRQTGIAKEIKAIDNEFELAAVDEDVQRFQVILSCFPKGFPLNKFPWGNAKSLQQKDEILQAETEKFYKTFYKNEDIKVCIHANYSLPELEEMLSKCFSDMGPGIKEQDEAMKIPDLADVKKSFSGGLYFLKSTSKIQKLTFTWVIDTLIREYQVLPLDLILSLLNERSSGSLYQRLMDENLITDLGAELDDIDGQINEYLYMPFLWFKLTDKGMQNVNLVIQYTGEYLNMLNLNALPDYYYNEAKTISQYEFRFADEVAEEDLTNVVSQSMKYLPYQQLLQSGIYRVFLKEDKALVAKVMSELAIRNARIDIQAPELPASLKDAKVNQIVDYEYEELYFKTKYTKLDIREIISPEVLNQVFDKGSYSESFTFPERNELIPEALPLHEINQDFVVPTRLKTNENVVNQQDNWFKVDTEFRIPKASIQFLVCFNLKREFASNVYLELAESYLLEVLFQGIGNKARKAGFECSIEKHEYFSLEITIYGFSGKIINLSKLIIDFLFSTLQEIRDDIFGQIVEKRTKFYEKALDDPERYLKIALIRYLYDFGLMPEEKIEFLKNPDLNSNFKAFCSKLVQSSSIRKIKTYAHGNLLQGDLNELYASLHDHIQNKLVSSGNSESGNHSIDALFTSASASLGSGLRIFPQDVPGAQLISHIKKQKNNMALYYLDLGEDNLENRVLCQLLNQIFNTELFESLRMKQQIGYIANSYPIVLSSLRVGLEVWVSSSKLNASEITQKIIEFIKWFTEEYLAKYDEKEFDDLRQSEISIKTKPFHSIQDAALDFWAEIKYNTLLPNRRQQEIQCLNQLDFKYFRNWTAGVFNNSKRLALELQSSEFKIKEAADAMEEEPAEGEEEDDYEDFEEEDEEEPEEEDEEEESGEVSEEAKKEFNLLFEQNLQKIKQNIANLKDVWTLSLD